MVSGSAARLLGKLRALKLPAGDYAIFGSGPLVVHGLIEGVRDLDVVARGSLGEGQGLGPGACGAGWGPVGSVGGWSHRDLRRLGWNIDLDSEEGREAFHLINDEGLRVFREQPGFVRYRLMVAAPSTTIAVAEWESEKFGKPGAQRYREWLRSSGIAQKLSLETYDGEVVVAS